MNNNLSNIISYYQELGSLFNELSGGSRFFNLGIREERQKRIDIRTAQIQLVNLVVELGAFRPGMRLLDVGCGAGGPAGYIAKEIGCHVIGIDPGSFQIRAANARHDDDAEKARTTIHYANAMCLPFKADSFDRVYSIESAFHYSDKETFLKEGRRVLIPGGLMIIADILQESGKDSWLTRRMAKALATEHFFSAAEYERAFEKAGLQVLKRIDITDKVRRTFPLWTRSFILHFNKLVQYYPTTTLAKIGLALMLAAWMSPFTHFKYEIFCLSRVSIPGQEAKW
jgi:cyclopropane fatty-acyl-phospholipid synthase-like methyltransferase